MIPLRLKRPSLHCKDETSSVGLGMCGPRPRLFQCARDDGAQRGQVSSLYLA